MDILVSLSNFQKTRRYQDISTLKTKPRTVTVDKEKSTKIQFYQTKSSIQSLKSKVIGRITIDIQVDQAQLDILAEYNFLVSSIQIEVQGDRQFTDYGTMEIVDNNKNSIYTARNAIRTIGTGDIFERGTYTLIIKTDQYSKNLFKGLAKNDIPVEDELILPITIRIESTPITGKLEASDGKLRLIDIEYNGDPDDDGKYINTEEKLSIVLEFNNDLDDSELKMEENTSFAVLILDSKFHKGAIKGKKIVKPSQIDKSSVISENMVQLIFNAKTLQKGATYTLQLDKRIGINQDLLDLDTFTIKTSKTKCNPQGSVPTKDNKGCRCKYPYKGPTCNECQDDYHFNKFTKECIMFETCSNEICNNHGQCIIEQETGAAKCLCFPGFTDDAEGAHCGE